MYSWSFAEVLIRIFGLSSFCKRLLKYYVEALAGSKEAGCEDLGLIVDDDRRCEMQSTAEQMLTPRSTTAAAAASEGLSMVQNGSTAKRPGSNKASSVINIPYLVESMRRNTAELFDETASKEFVYTSSPSVSLDPTESIESSVIEEQVADANKNYEDLSSPIKTPVADPSFSFTDMLQMSYSRHRRGTSRDTRIFDPVPPKSPYNHNLLEKENSTQKVEILSVSQEALNTCMTMVTALGPRVAAKWIITNLLTQAVHCFECAASPEQVSLGLCSF